MFDRKENPIQKTGIEIVGYESGADELNVDDLPWIWIVRSFDSGVLGIEICQGQSESSQEGKMRFALGGRLALIAMGWFCGATVVAQESGTEWHGFSPSLLPQSSSSPNGFGGEPIPTPAFADQNQMAMPQPVPSGWNVSRSAPQGTGVLSEISKVQAFNSGSPVPPASLPMPSMTPDLPQRYPLPERVPQLNAPALPIAQSVAYPDEPQLTIPSPPPSALHQAQPSGGNAASGLDIRVERNAQTLGPENVESTPAELYLDRLAAGDEVADPAGTVEAEETYIDAFDACSTPHRAPVWFGGAYGLVMMRDYESVVPLSYDPTSPQASTLSSDDSDFTAMGGVEAILGRHYANGLGWQLGYWGLYPGEQSWEVGGFPDSQRSGLSDVNYTAAGFGTNDGLSWFDAGVAHRVYRQNEIHNLEFNLLSSLPLCLPTCNPCFDDCADPSVPRYTVSMFGGLRYFNFDEFFGYRSTVEGSFTNDARDLYHNLRVDNHLVGLQLGGHLDFRLRRKLTLTGGTKVGAFANYMEHEQELRGPSGYATINSGPSVGRDYDFESDKTDLAMLGELSLGLAYQMTKSWKVTGGYRALGISGVALAPNQISANYASQSEAENINSEGSLILHGAYFGIEFAY